MQTRNPSPLVTVFITTFNHEKFIAESIDSVLNQTLVNMIEIIIVDDCSNDRTVEIIREYQSRIPVAMRVFVNPSNRTTLGYLPGYDAVKTVRGRYIAFLDGDDYWTDTRKLELQVSVMEASASLSGCAHSTCIHDQVTVPANYWRYYNESRILYFNDIVGPVTPFHTSSFMMRSYCLDSFLEFFDMNPTCISGDLVLYAIAGSYGSIALLPQVMSAYRVHPTGITSGYVHKSPFQFLHNRFRMWAALARGLGKHSQILLSLAEIYRIKANEAFLSLRPSFVVLVDENSARGLPEIERSIGLLANRFVKTSVFYIHKIGDTESTRVGKGEHLISSSQGLTYGSQVELIKVLTTVIDAGEGPLVLCSVKTFRLERILSSLFCNSLIVMSEGMLNCSSLNNSDVFISLNNLGVARRLFMECDKQLALNNKTALSGLIRAVLPGFNLTKPDVVSVV